VLPFSRYGTAAASTNRFAIVYAASFTSVVYIREVLAYT